MKHRHTLYLFPLAFLTLAGCGSDNGESAFNPATNVELAFSTFDLALEADLEKTLFWDFYRGIEPADQSDGDATAWTEALRRHIDVFIGSEPTEDGAAYANVRNPLDLINQVIGTNAAANFTDGRRYMNERIDLGSAGTYNSLTKGARIRFVDRSATEEGAALANRQWNYRAVGWLYTPDTSNKVFRTIQYIARTASEEESVEAPELQSLLVGARYNPRTFDAVGYNQPELVEASFTARTYGRLSLSQDFVADHDDSLFVSETDKISVNGQTPDCVRAVLDYDMSELVIFSSDNEPSEIEDPDTGANSANPDYCGNLEEGRETIRYATSSISERKI